MTRAQLLILPLMWSSFAGAASPRSTSDVPIREWQARSFRFNESFSSEFPSFETPAPDAGEKAWVQHIRQATEVFEKYFAKLHLSLPPGTAFAFDLATSTLAVRTHPEELDAIEAYAAAATSRASTRLIFQLNLVQADGDLLRKITAKSMTQANMEPQWEQLLQLAGRGQTRLLQTARWEGRSGEHASFETGPNYPFPLDFKLDAAGRAEWKRERRCAGLRIEMDPTVLSGHWRVDLNLDFEYHYAALTERMELVRQAGLPGRVEVPLTDDHCATVNCSMSFGSGMTRLIGVWKPEGLPELERQDVLQAAFLRVDNAALLPVANLALAANLEKYADNVRPLPKGAKDQSLSVPAGMQRRVFKVPADLFVSAEPLPDSSALPPDPFAAKAAPLLAPADPAQPDAGQRLQTPKDFLTSIGIPVPKEAHAFFDRRLCLLTLVNTPENLDLFEAYIDSLMWCMHPNGLICTLQIIQADDTTLRTLTDAAAGDGDHSAMLHMLEELAAQGKARFISTQRVETHSGQHTEISAGEKRMEVAKFRKLDPNGGMAVVVEPVFIGTQLQLEPLIGPDGYTVDVNGTLEHHFLPSSQTARGEVPEGKSLQTESAATETHATKITLHTTQWIRTSRLLALWKPEGLPQRQDENLLQAAFLTLNYLRFDEADLEPTAEK